MGLGNPCTSTDMNLFHAGHKDYSWQNGKDSFLGCTWLNGVKPNVSLLWIFMSSKRKKWNVKTTLVENDFAAKIKVSANFTYEHVVQFVELWTQLQGIHLIDDIEDNITWTLTANGKYSVASAYKVQFFGAISTNMNKTVSL
jgi:hypothetical protein